MKDISNGWQCATVSTSMIPCNCPEMISSKGDRMTLEYGEHHDCGYARKRAALIDRAMFNVIEENGYYLPAARFTRLFAREMEELCRVNRLI